MTNEDRYIAELEDKVRFFTSAYGIEEGTPFEIIHAATGVLQACSKDGVVSDDAKRVMRHVIAQGNRAEIAETQVRKLHEAVLHVTQALADTAALMKLGAQTPPSWLLSLVTNLDMVLSDLALEKR